VDPFIMYLTVGVSLVDAVLAGVLLAIYAREYSRIRAQFTLGLVMFAAFFLAQNLLAAYGYLVLMVFLPDNVQPIMLAIMLLEALALAVMAYSAVSVGWRRGTGDSLKSGRVRANPPAGTGTPSVPAGKGP